MIDVDQIGILVFSCASIWFLARPKAGIRRIGYVLGLMGQPFWLYATITKAQWGMVAVSVWFTYCHCRGIYAHWKG